MRPGVSDGRLVREQEIAEAAEAISIAQRAAAVAGTLEDIPSKNCRSRVGRCEFEEVCEPK